MMHMEQVVPPSLQDEPPRLEPPSDRTSGIKRPFLLVVQCAWLLLLVVPSILYSVLRSIFPPSKSFKNTVVVVTGAGRGLGRGLALRFAKEGAKVAVVDVFSVLALETAQDVEDAGGIAKAYTANVASVEDIQRLHIAVRTDLGPVDVLINNAGLMYPNSMDDLPEEELRAVVEVNMLSHFRMTKEFLPSMKERNSGHIVAISSASAFMGLANGSVYSSCKAAVKVFMDCLRMELNTNAENKIKTTTVLPYFINTSDFYMKHVDLRMPELSVEDAVETIFTAITREQVVLSVPASYIYAAYFSLMLPQNVYDLFRKIFYCTVKLPTKEERSSVPTQHIIDNVVTKKLHVPSVSNKNYE